MKKLQSYGLLERCLDAARFLGRYSSSLAAIPAWIAWFTPWPVPISERAQAKQRAWLARVEHARVDTSVGEVAVFTAGSGKTILLVHGWGERAAGLGAFIEPLIGAGYRVLGIDLPAHGDSPGSRTNLIRAGSVVREIAEGVDAAAVIGHSMGGNCVLWALRHGLELQRVALLAPNVDLWGATEEFQRLAELPERTMRGLRRAIEWRFGKNVWLELDGVELARGLEVPGLVVHDPADPQVPYEGSERLVSVWPNAKLVTTEGLDHGKVTRDAGVVRVVVDFLTAESSRTVVDVRSSRAGNCLSTIR